MGNSAKIVKHKYSNMNIAIARKNVGEIKVAKDTILKQVDALHKMGQKTRVVIM